MKLMYQGLRNDVRNKDTNDSLMSALFIDAACFRMTYGLFLKKKKKKKKRMTYGQSYGDVKLH